MEQATHQVKFLVIRLGAIGDIVNTSAYVRCLKEQVENCHIDFLTKKQFVPILSKNPNIDQVLELSENLDSQIEELKNGLYDYVIDLHNNIRSTRIRNRMKVLSFVIKKNSWEKWVLVNFKKNIMPQKHLVDKFFDTSKAFGLENDQKGLEYFIEDESETDVGSFGEAYGNGFVAFSIGGKYFTKRYPASSVIRAIEESAKPAILLGGLEDKSEGDLIALECKGTVFNACGMLSLAGSASVVRQARVVVSNDTGLMHIAAAYKKKIISLWGSTVPEFGFYPYMPHPGSVILEDKTVSCRPCSKLGFRICPKKHFKCMMNIDPKELSKHIVNLW